MIDRFAIALTWIFAVLLVAGIGAYLLREAWLIWRS